MPIDWGKLKPQMTDLALEHICRRCKRIIPGVHWRIAGEDGNYHTSVSYTHLTLPTIYSV